MRTRERAILAGCGAIGTACGYVFFRRSVAWNKEEALVAALGAAMVALFTLAFAPAEDTLTGEDLIP